MRYIDALSDTHTCIYMCVCVCAFIFLSNFSVFSVHCSFFCNHCIFGRYIFFQSINVLFQHLDMQLYIFI